MASKEQAKKTIAALIARYEGLGERGRKALNEANTRKDYILPLFEALGWSVYDSSEVSEEVRVGEKWADYEFKIGSITRFFVEAKAADVDLELEKWAHQAVSYAYNKGIGWAVLTNFEGLKLFSAEWDERDVAKLRVLDLHYNQYLDTFDELWALSKASVKDDGLRKKFETRGGAVRKRLKVDERLFKLLKEWRLKLIQIFVKYQPADSKLRLGEIDEAVQRILDRLIFIRTIEDRWIENPILSQIEHRRRIGRTASGADAWTSLREEFRRLDLVYNSNLFAEHLADNLHADESAFLPMLAQLYTPDGAAFKFDFSVIEADVLGRVYEQYLGHVIETTKSPVRVGGKVYLPGMQPANAEMVDVVAKQAKRKQQGIYYTPKYVVDYIVEQTLGRLLDERGGDKKFVEQIAVLDPACGSGSFLIAAYERLLRYYAEVKQKAPEHLDQDERVEILLRHIYGVDLDPQAVEIARLNLLLRALKEPKRLPEMDNNIVRGNSLVGEVAPDSAGAHAGATLLPDAHPLNWHERFPQVMGKGGFDVVIGNPPYVRQEAIASYKEFFEQHYKSYQSSADLYVYFIERGLELLCANGLFSVIVSSSFLRTTYATPLREYLRNNYGILQLIDFGGQAVFESAQDIYVCIPLIGKRPQPEQVEVCKVQSLDNLDLKKYVPLYQYRIQDSQLTSSEWSLANEKSQALIEKVLSMGTGLGQYLSGRIFYGIKTGLNEAFVIDADTREQLLNEDARSVELIKPFLQGRDIRRFRQESQSQFLILIPNGWTSANISGRGDPWKWFSKTYPALAKHLDRFSQAAKARQDQGEYWWELRPCDYYAEFEQPKITYPDIAKGPRFHLDTAGTIVGNTGSILGTDDLYLLGLLNSRLSWFMIGSISIPFGIRAGEYRYRLIYQYMEKLPIRVLNFADPTDVTLHDRVVQHVKRLLELHRLKAEATPMTNDYDEREREIAAEDSALDGLVYHLYGLTEEEIAIVEGRA